MLFFYYVVSELIVSSRAYYAVPQPSIVDGPHAFLSCPRTRIFTTANTFMLHANILVQAELHPFSMPCLRLLANEYLVPSATVQCHALLMPMLKAQNLQHRRIMYMMVVSRNKVLYAVILSLLCQVCGYSNHKQIMKSSITPTRPAPILVT